MVLTKVILSIVPNLDKDEQAEAFKFAEHWQYSPGKRTLQSARNRLPASLSLFDQLADRIEIEGCQSDSFLYQKRSNHEKQI